MKHFRAITRNTGPVCFAAESKPKIFQDLTPYYVITWDISRVHLSSIDHRILENALVSAISQQTCNDNFLNFSLF